MKNSLFLAILISIMFVSCVKNDVFFSYKTIPLQGWSKDSLVTFDVAIKDTTVAYNLYVNVRNRGEYPYQNLWIFLSKKTPASMLSKDSIECYLADNRGKWLGTGIGSVMEMSVLYQQNVRFSKAGIYQYKIAHGMRDSVLSGLNDIGFQVEKVK